MKKTESAPNMIRHPYPRWIHLVLAAMMVLCLGITQGQAAPNKNSKKPRFTRADKTALKQGGFLQAPALPALIPDIKGVPHYFGPSPNWANSSFALPDALVEITGDGTGATAFATVGANGAITGITVVDPGSGYTSALVNITSGAGNGASATAEVSTTGVVTGFIDIVGGSGYTAPNVTIAGGCLPTGSCEATATAYGFVDTLTLDTPGNSYTNPTVDFDLPDAPNGVQAKAHVEFDSTSGVITAIILDNPGSGYASAPNVVIRDGTISDPINNGGSGATASATLSISDVVVDTFGAGYMSPPRLR